MKKILSTIILSVFITLLGVLLVAIASSLSISFWYIFISLLGVFLFFSGIFISIVYIKKFFSDKNNSKIVMKYLPDIFILVGVCIFGYIHYFPPVYLNYFNSSLSYNDDAFSFLALILISLGVVISIRKYVNIKTK
ncbi:MAG: hypothetical protein ACD_18C00307G0002 [uncultured bacterium]|nr:MAG: hypothetical protein ACD_18C00307G0002 [uncultured bacterium]OGH90934.1 MAG: hypothetical protein A2507_05220 [Candidatus Magasanikbacteria bacterium RIFOXYD12_FULL_33_17]HAO52647.1 hypothetical protein [Candidatus Magasanikbacteria bacterium]